MTGRNKPKPPAAAAYLPLVALPAVLAAGFVVLAHPTVIGLLTLIVMLGGAGLTIQYARRERLSLAFLKPLTGLLEAVRGWWRAPTDRA